MHTDQNALEQELELVITELNQNELIKNELPHIPVTPEKYNWCRNGQGVKCKVLWMGTTDWVPRYIRTSLPFFRVSRAIHMQHPS